MIAVFSDTHGREDARLDGRSAEAVAEADRVIHAGDFVREPVLDAFVDKAEEFVAVYGNVDDEGVRSRLPRARTLTVGPVTIALVHTVEGGKTGLELFGREREADLVISGHTHVPGYEWTGDLGLLNPGSHADPRGNRPAYAELEIGSNHLHGRLCEPDGTVFERFEIEMD